MNEEWLVDGYNLLHHILSLKNSPCAISPTREALCAALAGFGSFKRQKIRLVLDGAADPEELKIHQTRYFEAVYSQKVSADHHIEEYICRHKKAVAFVVVTDDRAITRMALGGGARVLRNAQFLQMLKDCRGEGEETLWKEKVRSHGFNRPFGEKFKDRGL